MRKNAFTLIEVLFAIILVGIAIVSLVGANISFTKVNGMGADMSTAEFLIEQIRELTALATYNDLDDFNGRSYCPPINSRRTALIDFARFTQQITVENVSAADLQTTVGNNNSDFYRVTVKILLNGQEISTENWIRARY
jgi:prepilin-type N-terminal cleavage/methylation domain-containing protein